MQDIVGDPLIDLVEGFMHETIAAGGDVRELAAVAVDAAIAEAIGLLEIHAASLKEPYAQMIIQDCVERILAAQFSGYVPPPAHLHGRRR